MPAQIARRVSIFVVIILVGVAGLMWLGSMKAAPVPQKPKVLPPLVSTVELQAGNGEFDIVVDGTVIPKRSVPLAAEVAGQIVAKYPVCEAGVYVEAGTPLLRIDPIQYQIRVDQLESELTKAQIDLDQLDIEIRNNHDLVAIRESELGFRNKELERLERLFQQKTVSEGDRDRIASEVLQIEAALQQLINEGRLLPKRRDALAEQLQISRKQLESAKLDLDKTEIRATISGVITADAVEERQFVQPGTVVVQIDDLSSVDVRCQLRLRQLNWLWNSKGGVPPSAERTGRHAYEIPRVPATVFYALDENRYSWSGQLSRYDGTGIDERTRTVPCLVEVPNPRRDGAESLPTLVRGMYVEVRLHVQPTSPVVRVPAVAVQPDNTVWTVEEGVLRVHPIRIAQHLADEVLIHADAVNIAEGSHLVITPLVSFYDGMPVRTETTVATGTSG